MEETQQNSNQNPISTVPPLTTPPMTQPAPTSKTPWTFIILIAVLLGVASYFGYQNYQLRGQLVDQQPVPSSTVIANSPIPMTSGPTSSWQTYFDYQNNYSFNYPNNFRIIAKGSSHYLLPTDSSDDTHPPFIFNTYDNPKNLTIPEFVEEAGKDGPSPNFYTVNSFEKMVDNITGYYDENTGCEPVLCDKFTMTYNKKIYEFASLYFNEPGQSADPSQREMFNQILSTFKFTK